MDADLPGPGAEVKDRRRCPIGWLSPVAASRCPRSRSGGRFRCAPSSGGAGARCAGSALKAASKMSPASGTAPITPSKATLKGHAADQPAGRAEAAGLVDDEGQITMPATSPTRGTRPISASKPARRLMPGITKAVPSGEPASPAGEAGLAAEVEGGEARRLRPGLCPREIPVREGTLGESHAGESRAVGNLGVACGSQSSSWMTMWLRPRFPARMGAVQAAAGRDPAMRSRAASRVASALAKHRRTMVRTAPSG